MDGRIVEHEVVRNTTSFLSVYIIIFVVSLLLISLDSACAAFCAENGHELLSTNFTAVAATLNNIGPGLGAVGPEGNFACYTVFSKLVFIFDMLAGRLELFPMLLLLHPATWKK